VVLVKVAGRAVTEVAGWGVGVGGMVRVEGVGGWGREVEMGKGAQEVGRVGAGWGSERHNKVQDKGVLLA
jgi:hypothetical protein